MSDDKLGEQPWKRFAKGKDWKDAAFVKALQALDAAGEDAARQLSALQEIDKQAEALRKSAKADKALQGYLDEVDKLLQKRRKAAEAEAKREAEDARRARQDREAAAARAAEDEEDDSPAVLTRKLVPLLRLVRKGEVMQAMVGVTGKQAVVLLARRGLTPARRRLLADYARDSSGMKFATGECRFEAGAVTFVVPLGAAGLAKKLRAGLLEQTGLRLKVRVRGDDGEDSDGEDEGADAPDPASTAPPGDPGAPAPAPGATPAVDLKTVTQRLAAAQRALQAALAGPAAAELRPLVAVMSAALKAGDAAAADAALDRIEALLPRPGAEQGQASPRSGPVDYARCRLAWELARKKVHGELQALERLLLERYRHTRGYAELQQKVRRFDQVLAGFEGDLEGLLDQALNATGTARRDELHAQAQRLVRRFLARAQQDAFIDKLQGNPFMPLTVKASLVATLGALDQRLA